MTFECPDIETSTSNYAKRFSGDSGKYLLNIQEKTISNILKYQKVRTVLDIGGGHGQLTQFFIDRGCDVTIIGSSDNCFNRIKNKYSKNDINIVTGNLLNTPFKNESFDLVISIRLISHLHNWDALIKESCRLAKTNVVLDYPPILGYNLLSPVFFRLKKSIEKNTRKYKCFSHNKLQKEFIQHGFSINQKIGQFLLPMSLHRLFKSPAFVKSIEEYTHQSRVFNNLKSPIILRADRIQI